MAICSGDGWMDEKADENKYDVYENFICMFFSSHYHHHHHHIAHNY